MFLIIFFMKLGNVYCLVFSFCCKMNDKNLLCQINLDVYYFMLNALLCSLDYICLTFGSLCSYRKNKRVLRIRGQLRITLFCLQNYLTVLAPCREKERLRNSYCVFGTQLRKNRFDFKQVHHFNGDDIVITYIESW